MTTNTDLIKQLRSRTSAGVMDCKRALDESNGDLDEAEKILKEQGIASAAKKSNRDTDQGVIETYIHSGGRIAAMVEVNCETDFVARTDEFSSLAHDIAMQIAAMAPVAVSSGDPIDGEEPIPEDSCLLQQPFIKDPSKSIQDLINETVGKLGENIRVRRFQRFSLGE
ncbi:MAG: translation elongation factor Ts [Chloroflexota bacterium]|uniref:Translation elongation factor EFTs/EF1B dimerisation domain-containing protein n=1 Tax=marine metagenome TaxID=408172 RepID=A0A381VCR3_9ZZZZ|nr:translation elongation factor Ts [Chloroflexota bacterium]